MKRVRSEQLCRVCVASDETDSVQLLPDCKTYLGRRSFTAYAGNLLCSREQVEVVYRPRSNVLECTGSVRKNSSFIRACGESEWRRLGAAETVHLVAGDSIQLVNDGAVLVVDLQGGRVVKYEKESGLSAKTSCLYGAECRKLENVAHLERFHHLDAKAKAKALDK